MPDRNPTVSLSINLSLIYAGTIGQPKQTTSHCDSKIETVLDSNMPKYVFIQLASAVNCKLSYCVSINAFPIEK
jgi:hypothetical protein